MNAGLSTKNAPSPKVVLPHYVYGAFAFLTAAIMMFFASGEMAITTLSPKILAVVHLLILGWITMIIFGALYQLLPVVMEVKLFSETLAIISFILLAVGTPLMVFSFWTAFIGPTVSIMAGGTAVILSAIIFAINTLLTARKSPVKTIENRFIITSVIYLLITIFIGIFIIIKPAILGQNFLQIHIHFGIIGWFMMLVAGVASVLLPMFFIAHNLQKKYLHAAYFLINGGLIAYSTAMFFKAHDVVIFLTAAIIISGFFLFIRYNFDAYKARLRKKLDIGMKHTVMAFVLLMITLIAALLSATGDLLPVKFATKMNLIYGLALIPGFLTAIILGQMYKTLPFIVWLKKYQDKVGKFKTPLPADLHSEKAAQVHYYSYLVAIVVV